MTPNLEGGDADTTIGIAFALTKNRLTPGFDTAEQVDRIMTKAVADSNISSVARTKASRVDP